MEPGPALYFGADELTIAAEPALAEGFDTLHLPELGQIHDDLGVVEQSFNQALSFLQEDALSWQSAIDDVSGVLDSDLANVPTDIPDDIQANRGPAQEAIDGAESSFLPDAYEETAPWMQPQFWETPPDITLPPDAAGEGAS